MSSPLRLTAAQRTIKTQTHTQTLHEHRLRQEVRQHPQHGGTLRGHTQTHTHHYNNSDSEQKANSARFVKFFFTDNRSLRLPLIGPL